MMFTDGVFISILMNTQALNRNFKVLNISFYIKKKYFECKHAQMSDDIEFENS